MPVNISQKRTMNAKKLYKAMTQLSFRFQNINLNNSLIILVLLVIPRLMQTILPSIAIIENNTNSFEDIQRFAQFLLFQLINIQNSSHINLIGILQVAISVALISFLKVLFIKNNNKAQIIVLRFIIILYHTSSFILIVLSQILAKIIRNWLQNDQLGQTLNNIMTYFTFILTLANMILIFLLGFIYQIISQSYNLNVNNLICANLGHRQMIADFLTKVGMILMICISQISASQTKYNVHIAYIVCIFIITMLRLYDQMTYYQYNSKIVYNFNRRIISFQLSILLTVLLVEFIQSFTLISQNYFQMALSLSFFIGLTLETYLSYIQNHLKLLVPDQIYDYKTAVLYCIKLSIMINDTVKGYNKQQYFYLRSIIKTHQEMCTDTQCFCKTQIKNKQNNQILYFKIVFAQLVESLYLKFPQAIDLYFLIIFQNFSIFKNFLHQDFKFNSVSTKSDWKYKFNLQKYQYTVKSFLETKQKQQKIANTEKYFQFQKIQSQFKQKIITLVKLKIQFWNNLKKTNIIKQQLENVCQKQLKLLRVCQQLKNFIWKYYINYSLINLIVNYERFILLKLKPQSQFIQFLQKQQIIQNRLIFKTQKNQMLIMNKYLETSLICCIQASLSRQNIGNIISATNSQLMFGYAKASLLNTNINIIIPKVMQNEHSLLMKNWIINCTWNNLGHFKQIYCNNKAGQILSCKIYMKVVQRIEASQNSDSYVTILATFIKQRSKNYLILDGEGCIVGIGEIFMKLFGPLIVGIPLEILCQDANEILSSKIQNNKIKGKSTFYSSNNIQDLLKSYHQRNNLIQSQKSIFIGKIRQLQKAQLFNFIIQYELSLYQIGRMKFILLQLVSVHKKNNLLSQKISKINDTLYIQPCQQQFEQYLSYYNNDHSNSFSKQKNYNKFMAQPSNTSAQSVKSSFQSNINILQNIFYQGYEGQKIKRNESQIKQNKKIYDFRVLRIVILLLGLCIAGIIVSGAKISINYNGFSKCKIFFSLMVLVRTTYR